MNEQKVPMLNQQMNEQTLQLEAHVEAVLLEETTDTIPKKTIDMYANNLKLKMI